MRTSFTGLLVATLLLSGCYTISYRGRGSPSGVEQEQWNNYFLWGLAPGSNDIDLQKLCPGGPARWKSQQSFVQGLIGVVTLGIYIPRSVHVECATGNAFLVPGEGNGAIPFTSAESGSEIARVP